MKLTTWNAEWLDSHWGVISGKYTPGQNLFPHDAPEMDEARTKIDAMKALVARVDPDILFLCEAPEGEAEMQAFTAAEMPGYELISRPAGSDYQIEGRQWLWFLMKTPLADQSAPELLEISVWQSFAASASPSIREDGKWSVAIPRLKNFGNIKDVPVSTRDIHDYHRHPQTLRFSFGGAVHEVIGAHLKSKFTGSTPRKRRPDESFDEYAQLKKVKRYLAKSHAARVKLSSEASNIRAYIDQRFSQETEPSIFVVGDLNDGPGKELMEREYLLHDLLSNLQGEVFFARRFLNHALFDQPHALRWTTQFDDALDPERDSHILLDHILFTQALTSAGSSPLRARAGAGRVEHLAYEEVTSLFGPGNLSDHRPVSVVLTPRDAPVG
jgi:hypothetical protein